MNIKYHVKNVKRMLLQYYVIIKSWQTRERISINYISFHFFSWIIILHRISTEIDDIIFAILFKHFLRHLFRPGLHYHALSFCKNRREVRQHIRKRKPAGVRR